MKAVPDWELISLLDGGPFLKFDVDVDAERSLELEQLNELRAKALKIADAAEPDMPKLRELVAECRWRWRRLVERSIGYQFTGGPVRRWDQRMVWSSDQFWERERSFQDVHACGPEDAAWFDA
jgi:hypothetical protein